LRSDDVGAEAEFWAEAEFAMPAARTTASAIVERERRGCISILTTRHDLKNAGS
jgi:hypothetical protein